MPTAPLGVCPHPGCPRRSRGLCPVHLAAKHQATDARRGYMHERGYDRTWRKFAAAFPRLLMARGILPTCGARYDGTRSPHSRCVQIGRVELEHLHCDHIEPLHDWERKDRSRVCNAHGVQLLCASCHSIKTRQEMAQRGAAGQCVT